MKNIFLAFIFIVCSVVAVNVFAQSDGSFCPFGNTSRINACVNLGGTIIDTPLDGWTCFNSGVTRRFVVCLPACPLGTVPLPLPAVSPDAFTCVPESCPEGQIVNLVGAYPNITASCVDDNGGEPEEPQECPEGQVSNPLALVAGSCTPIVDDPADCAGTGISQGQVVDIGGSLSCASDDRPCQSAGGEIGSIFLPGGASLPSCTFGGGGDDDSGSSSSSGDDGGGDDSGSSSSAGSGGDGDGDGSGSSSSSGSGGGGGGDGEGGSSGGDGCDAPPVCTGDEFQCMQIKQQYLQRCPNTEFIESTGLEFEKDLDGEIETLMSEYESTINDIHDDFMASVGATFSGTGGGLPSNVQNIRGVSVELGVAARSDFFDQIRNLIFFGFALLSFYILMRA